MWANGDDVNDNGEPVRLYQPIPYRARLTRGFENPTISRIGGPFSLATTEDDSSSLPSWRQRLVCSKCQDPLLLLAQLHVPLLQKDPSQVIQHRTIQVFGCNRASCFLSLFDDDDNNADNNKLCLGGGGVVVCRRFHFQQPSSAAPEVTSSATEALATTSHAWDAVDATSADSPWGENTATIQSDDWGVEDDANVDMKGIESMVAEMEMKSEEALPKKTLPTTKQSKVVSKETNSLPCFEVHSLQEPARRQADMVDEEDDEENDDNVGISSSSDDKIQQMLARYMAEEEDEDILAALRGGTSSAGGTSGGKKRRERDERLAPEDRALFAFTDRIKRAPRQVIRYARDGAPMWSVPISLPRQGDKGKKNQKSSLPKMQILKCSCGAERIFECQLLPSLLHILEVDKYARSKVDNGNDDQMKDLDVKAAFESGGMNWGSIAIYTCSQDCEASQEELVIIQDSLDGKPQKMNLASDQMAVLVQDQAMESDDDDNEYNENWDVDDDGDDEDEDDDDKPTKLCSLKVMRH